MKKESKLLLEFIDEEMEAESLLSEETLGNKFEQAIVDAALGRKSEYDKDTFSMGAGKVSLSRLADLAISQIPGLRRGKAGEAFVFNKRPSGGGDPKTDIVIDGKKISIKLPGAVQLASGEARSTLEALGPWMDEYLSQKLRGGSALVQKQVSKSWEEAKKELEKTIGKRYVTSDEKKRNDQLALQAKRRGIVPSKYIEKAEELIAKGALEATWEEWNERKPTIVNNFVKALSSDEELFNNIAYEFITGAKRFESEPEMIADYILSPDGFYDVSTKEKAAEYLDKMRKGISLDLRGKGRDYAAKAVAARIDVNAQDVYREEMIGNISKDLGIDPEELRLSAPDIYKQMTYHFTLPDEK
tara:strand:+ start:24095 stop:25168 length:1074 start_codon:yes stop_codon:yes gene_type:complete